MAIDPCVIYGYRPLCYLYLTVRPWERQASSQSALSTCSGRHDCTTVRIGCSTTALPLGYGVQQLSHTAHCYVQLTLHTAMYSCLTLHTAMYNCLTLYTAMYSCLTKHTAMYNCVHRSMWCDKVWQLVYVWTIRAPLSLWLLRSYCLFTWFY